MSRFIRVKRRLEEEPASVLYLAAKRARHGASSSDGITLKLLTTVGADGSPTPKQTDSNPQRSAEPRPESFEQAAARLKKRVRGGACRLRRLSGDEKENVILPENVTTPTAAHKRKGGVEIYDVILEDGVAPTSSKKLKPGSEPIMCNGVEMEVHATPPEIAAAKREEHDFVYDLYYLPDGDFGELSDPVFYLETDPYLNDHSLYGEYRDPAEADEDEDSNAEDNPRNDYPEEEDAVEADEDDENYYCHGVRDELREFERLTMGDDDGSESDDDELGEHEDCYGDDAFPKGYAAYKARVKRELGGSDSEKSGSDDFDDCCEAGSDDDLVA